MSWIILATLSYFLNAVVAVVDKFLVSNKVKNPLVYSFYTGVLGSAVLILWPIDFSFLPLNITLVALFSGVSFFLALYFYYASMIKTSVTRTVTVIGGISPIVLLGLSYFFLDERLPTFWLLAFAILILGSFLLTFGREKIFSFYAVVSAIFFALSFFTIKIVFLNSTFINGFVWTRVGFLILALFFLFFGSFRKQLSVSSSRVSNKFFALFVGNKAVGAVSYILLN